MLAPMLLEVMSAHVLTLRGGRDLLQLRDPRILQRLMEPVLIARQLYRPACSYESTLFVHLVWEWGQKVNCFLT